MRKMLCWVGLHDWSQWQAYGMREVYESTPKGCHTPSTWQTRRCKRCGYVVNTRIAIFIMPGVPVAIDETVPAGAPLGLDG